MEADEKIGFELPKKPKIEQKEPLPDQRKFAVVPLAALKDYRLSNQAKVVFAVVSSYANRAGITYVSQQHVADDLQIDQSQVSKAMVNLKKYGYVEILGKHAPGIRGKTLRIVFDPNVSAEEAVVIASANTEEDLRPPMEQAIEQKAIEEDFTPEQIKANKERLMQMVSQAFKKANPEPKRYQPVKGDTLTVKKIRQEIREKMLKAHNQPVDNSENKGALYEVIHDKNTYKHKNTYIYNNNTLYENNSSEIALCGKLIESRKLTFDQMLKCFNDNLFEQVKTNEDLKYLELLDQVGCVESDIVSACDRMRSGTVADVCKAIIKAKGM